MFEVSILHPNLVHAAPISELGTFEKKPFPYQELFREVYWMLETSPRFQFSEDSQFISSMASHSILNKSIQKKPIQLDTCRWCLPAFGLVTWRKLGLRGIAIPCVFVDFFLVAGNPTGSPHWDGSSLQRQGWKSGFDLSDLSVLQVDSTQAIEVKNADGIEAGASGCWTKNRGGPNPPKWMVYNNGRPYEQMDDLGGKNPYFRKHPNFLGARHLDVRVPATAEFPAPKVDMKEVTVMRNPCYWWILSTLTPTRKLLKKCDHGSRMWKFPKATPPYNDEP